MHEVVSLVAARRGLSDDEIERTHSFDQILLKRHFDVREEKRLIDYEAALTSSKIAEIFARALGG